MNKFQIVVGGAAGEGSKKAGQILARLFNAYGYRVFIHEDYHSLIRGGHNFSQISVSAEEKIDATTDTIDYLLALNKETVDKHKGRLKADGVLIYDVDTVDPELTAEEVFSTVPVPTADIIDQAGGSNLMKNTAIVTEFAKMMGLDLETVKAIYSRMLTAEIEKNLKVAEVAFNRTESLESISPTGRDPLPLLTGNAAIAVGAIRAGLENYIAYPMTPATGVLTYLAKVDGVKTVQPENEISVINMALGSAYAGRRTMCGSSGGGFALMTETISLLGQSETPMQIVLSQRMGPASGVPTYEAQGDLLFAINAGHGDFDRVVTAPGDGDEAYYLSGLGLNLAWKYQIPVILLADKELSENTYTLKRETEVYKEDAPETDNTAEYKRYAGEDISPLQYPGGEAVVKATSYEHTPDGITTEEPDKIVAMQNKRMRKGDKLRQELAELETVKVYGQGPVAVIFWGSTKGAVLEATKDLNVRLIQPLLIHPLPEEQMKEALTGVEKTICVELNSSGQLAQVLKGYGLAVSAKILKYDARPFEVGDLRAKLEALINA